MSDHEEQSALPVFLRGDHVELGRALLAHIDKNYLKNVPFDEGSLYRYLPQHGLWAPVTADDASRIVQGFAGAQCAGGPKGDRVKPLKVNAPDVKGALKMAQDLAFKPGFFNDAPVGISFSNGFVTVDVNGIHVKPLRRENRMRHGFTWRYDPAAKSPLFLAFLDSLFRDDGDRVEKIAFIQELFGASLVRVATTYQKCAILIGDGENGKDTLIDILKEVFPPDTVTSVGPHKWSEDYSRARLSGAWLNIIGELPEKEMDSSEAFKAITVGGKIGARHPYGRVFEFKPIAGHVFAANAAMGTTDFSHGFFRRFCIVRFNRQFGPADRDPHIKEKIASENEAIIAWLIEGAARLIARGAYVFPASHDLEFEAWRQTSDQVAMFLEGKSRPCGTESWKSAASLYAAYVIWARENGHAPVSSTKFGTRAKPVLRALGLPDSREVKGVRYYPVTLKPWPDGGVGMRKSEGGPQAVAGNYPLPQNQSNISYLPKR